MKRPALLAASLLAATALTAAPAAAQTPSLTGPSFSFPSFHGPVLVQGGTTSLKLDAAVGAALASAHVSASPLAPAAAGPDGIGFPIRGGVLNPKTGASQLVHSGGLRFQKGSRQIDLTDFVVNTGSFASTLTARVNGRSFAQIIDLKTKNASVSSSALAITVSGVDAKLSATGAAALNRALGTSLFTGGLKLGSVTINAAKPFAILEGGATSLALDPAAGQALSSLGVAVAPVAPATAGPKGLSFPIVSGFVRGRDLAGTIVHRGGITFSAANGKSLTVTDFVIDTRRGVLTAAAGGARVDLLKLDLSAPAVSATDDEIVIGNVPASLTATAAQALNATFGVTAFTEGLRIGVATVDAEVR